MEIALMDMFYWEQRSGHWGTLTRAEQDRVNEGFLPLNNREFITLLTSLDIRYRKSPEREIFNNIIYYLWPEVLDVPVNPKTLRQRLFQHLKKLLPEKTLHLLKMVVK